MQVDGNIGQSEPFGTHVMEMNCENFAVSADEARVPTPPASRIWPPAGYLSPEDR
jgi:hypothetical protein